MKIEGTIVAITGGARGLGRVIADTFLSKGAFVEVCDRDAQLVDQLPSEIAGTCCDLTDAESVSKWIDGIVTKRGRIDVLVNNAGVIHSEPLVNMMKPDTMAHSYTTFQSVIANNLNTTFLTSSMVAEQMVRLRTKGVIVNVSSISATGNEGQTAYSAAKAGVNAMTVTWAKELGRFGIRCNAVAPGFIDTPSTRAALSEVSIQHLQSVTPLRRLGAPDEVAKAVIALVENDFLSGIILRVDGGLRV